VQTPSGETPPAGADAKATPMPITDAAWEAMLEKQVAIDVGDKTHTGKLAAVTEETVVLIDAKGDVQTLNKADATALRLAKKEPAPAPATTTPPVKNPPKPKKEDYPKFGVFTTHGLSYAHWRTRPYRSGSAAYALDLGAGYNFKETIGLYGVLGGNVAARIVDKQVKGNMGHFSAMIRYKKKYFAFLGGVGVAWSRLDEPTETDKDVGVVIPLKLMGHIPLPKHFYLGIGVGYELAIFARGRLFNAPSLQLLLARW
jgi:hypothetical protein